MAKTTTQASKRQVPSFRSYFHPSVQNRSALQLIYQIPPDVAQQEVWDAEERLRQVESVTTELQEPRDLVAPTLLFIHVAIPLMKDIAVVGGAIKATNDVAKIIHDFLHPAGKDKINARGKNKVVIVKKGKRIELYNLSTEEIVQVLEGQ